MERKDAKNGTSASVKDWGGFINLRLDDDEKTAFHHWRETEGSSTWELLQTVLDDGVKVSITQDAENQCHVVTLTGALVSTDKDHNYAVSSRAETWEEAVALMMYKHFALAQGDYANYKPRTSRMSWG